MARVTAEEVQEIITTSYSSITAFITAANLTITDKLGDNEDLSAEQLKEIERWLTAHLIAVAEKTIKAEDADDAGVTYAIPPLGKGLDATIYGQQVKVLDTTGTLSTMGMKKAYIQAIDFNDV